AEIQSHAQDAGFAEVVVYQDRRDLVERLQYLANRHGRTPPEPAAKDADKEEASALSLDQQKASANPGAGQDDNKVSDAKVIGEMSASQAAAPIPSASPAPASSSAGSAASSPAASASASSPSPASSSPSPLSSP